MSNPTERTALKYEQTSPKHQQREQPPWRTRSGFLYIVLYIGAHFLNSCSVFMVYPLVSIRLLSTGATQTDIATVFISRQIGSTIGAPVAAFLNKKVGQAFVLVMSVSLLSAFNLVTGFLGDIYGFYISFMVFGFASVCLKASMMPVIRREFAEYSSLVMGFYEFGGGLGGVIGPLVGTVLYDITGEFYFTYLSVGFPMAILAIGLGLTTKTRHGQQQKQIKELKEEMDEINKLVEEEKKKLKAIEEEELSLSYTETIIDIEEREKNTSMIGRCLQAFSFLSHPDIYNCYLNAFGGRFQRAMFLVIITKYLLSFNLPSVVIGIAYSGFAVGYTFGSPLAGWIITNRARELSVIICGTFICGVSLFMVGSLVLPHYGEGVHVAYIVIAIIGSSGVASAMNYVPASPHLMGTTSNHSLGFVDKAESIFALYITVLTFADMMGSLFSALWEETYGFERAMTYSAIVVWVTILPGVYSILGPKFRSLCLKPKPESRPSSASMKVRDYDSGDISSARHSRSLASAKQIKSLATAVSHQRSLNSALSPHNVLNSLATFGSLTDGT